jgi:hypothetical protein
LLRRPVAACALAAAALALAAGSALLASASSAAEPPPLPTESTLIYQYFALGAVSVEVNGSYSEHYTDPEGDEEIVDFQFTESREFHQVEWRSSTPAPAPGGEVGYLEDSGQEHLEASGTFEFVNGSPGLKGQTTTCSYAPTSSEPHALDDPSGASIEIRPEQEAGLLFVRFSYPLAGNLITVKSGEELCEGHAGVGTSGEADKDAGYQEAVSRALAFLVTDTAPETLKFPNSYATTVDGDRVELNEEAVVKTEPPLLPPPIATPPKGPLEKREPSTPVPPPTTPPKPPVIQEPEVEANPPVITGGGGSPPKLHTGITAKCPPAGKPCTVTGIVEAELPAPRPAGKASASRKAKLRRVVLGKVSFALAAGASKKVVITLSKAGAALLRSHPGVRAKIAVTVAAPGAAKASSTRTAKLRLPAPRRHR